jgi:hypothetical protein
MHNAAPGVYFAIPIQTALKEAADAIHKCEGEPALSCRGCGATLSGVERYCSACGRSAGLHMPFPTAALVPALAIALSQEWPAVQGTDSLQRVPLQGLVLVQQMIAQLLDAYGLDSYASRVDRNRWVFRHQDRTTELGLTYEAGREAEASLYLRLVLCSLPASEVLPFLRALLETNNQLLGMPSLGVDELNQVWLSTARPIQGLDADELTHLLTHTQRSAELILQQLRKEFGTFDQEVSFGGIAEPVN